MFSAVGFLKHLESIKDEASEKGLNRAYIPILQQISPGDIKQALNAVEFATNLVGKWLKDYKFRDWKKHSNGDPVTNDERTKRAEEIAAELCDYQKWLTHGRSIKIEDFRNMRLKISDFTEPPFLPLADPIRRYHALLYITFESNVFKLFETPSRVIARTLNTQVQMGTPQQIPPELAETVDFTVQCAHCQKDLPIRMKLKKGAKDEPDRIPYPKNDVVTCPYCSTKNDLAGAKRNIEQKMKRKVEPL